MALLTKPQMNSSLDKALRELGLSPQERSLYHLSLQTGPASIVRLSKLLGVARPNAYKLVAGLQNKGLARFAGKTAYTKQFSVESPSVVGQLIRHKRDAVDALDQDLTSALPDLLSRYKQGMLPTKIQTITGHKNFLDAYVQVFEEANSTIAFFGSTTDFLALVSPQLGAKRIRRRVTRGIKVQLLGLPSRDVEEFKKRDAQELRETRTLKGAAPFKTSFYLYANKVLLWQPAGELAVRIEDQYFVAMFRSMFNWMWERSLDK
jgi:sugar-specific transcriptional regulator TrmB